MHIIIIVFFILVIDIILALKALWSCAPSLVRKFRSFALNRGLQPSPTSIFWVPQGAPGAPGSLWVRFNLISLNFDLIFWLVGQHQIESKIFISGHFLTSKKNSMGSKICFKIFLPTSKFLDLKKKIIRIFLPPHPDSYLMMK